METLGLCLRSGARALAHRAATRGSPRALSTLLRPDNSHMAPTRGVLSSEWELWSGSCASHALLRRWSSTTQAAPPTVQEEVPSPKPAKKAPKRSIKSLLRALPLNEEELEETFVRGSGPGGQSINKTSISCSLIHVPSGIRVQVHETRSREQNRLIARRRLAEKVDVWRNPDTNVRGMAFEKERKKKEAKRRKRGRKGKGTAEGSTATVGTPQD